MAEQEVAVVPPVAEQSTDKEPATTDLKRKLDDLEPQGKAEADLNAPSLDDLPKDEFNSNFADEAKAEDDSLPDAKKPRLDENSDGSALENGHGGQKPEDPAVASDEKATTGVVEAENARHENTEKEKPLITPGATDTDHATVDNTEFASSEKQAADVSKEGYTEKPSDEARTTSDVQHPSGDQEQQLSETQPTSHKMEVPNSKVGVLIGKSGDTIRYLQMNSGAKIQITRDAEADPQSTTRPVELIGTLESIAKAEKLIKEVLAEADAGGSPALVARGLGSVQATGPAEQIQIQVPNEKVGMIIGRGGENIKNLQTKSGARIQLIPQHLPEGDQSKERTVRVTGDKKQIEVARDLIKEVMTQPVRSSSHSGGHNQQGYRPRGPSGSAHWGGRGPPSGQSSGYGNQQRGMYPSHNSQYMPPAYGGYPQQQSAPRGNFNAGWDQRGPMQATPPPSGYDHYARGGHVADSSAPGPISNAGPGPASAHGAPPTHANYNNYGQSQGPDYGQPNYSQQVPSQQNYGQVYDNAKYPNQVPPQQPYGGHGNPQPGAYAQQVASQPGYAQAYSKPPAYGMPSQGPSQNYVQPRPGQPGDVPYQNQAYGPTVPSQQSYPYASGGPAPQTYPYNSAQPATEVYNQPQNHSVPAPVYPQQAGQPVPGYVQPTGQPAPGYAQGGQAPGYGPYASQHGYGEQPVPTNAGYGSQAPDPAYGNAPAQAYGAPATAQANYVQPPSNQQAYEQPAPQAGAYANVQQPVYGQYDSTQMYGAQH